MAVAQLSKLFVAVHKSEEREFLSTLKQYSIVELHPYDREHSEKIQGSSDIENSINRVKRVKDILNKYTGLLGEASRTGKIKLSRNEYKGIIEDTDYESICTGIENAERQLGEIKTKEDEYVSRINQLNVWKDFRGNLADIGVFENHTLRLGKITCKKNELSTMYKQFEDIEADMELVRSNGNVHLMIIAYHNDFDDKAEHHFTHIPFEEADIEHMSGTVMENIDEIGQTLNHLRGERDRLLKDMKILVSKYEKTLTVILDYMENSLDVDMAMRSGYSTDYVSFYTFWVRAEDRPKLTKACETFNFFKMDEMKIGDKEDIPIVLENKKIFKPFEIVTNLYGVPKYHEIDPTPFLSIFFALFFGLCLTDAGYGLILFVAGLILMNKMKASRHFMQLFAISGLFTILAGAAFNGWFGDLPSYLGAGPFFEKLAIFGDPIKTDEGSMNFFRLALLLGIIQIFYGMFIKFFDALKRKQYDVAFFDTLTWIVLVGSLVIMLLSSDMAVSMKLVTEPMFPPVITTVLTPFVLISALVIILFAARNEENWGFRLFMGFLNLTIVNGITAYLGDSLSYIRLMALGLVTAGIGVAINKIAFQTLSVPVAGIIIMLVIMIFGHLFNLAINVLGAFVHTLRLQYVEFFQKFYEGGGRPFKAITEEHKYVILTD